jgi:hypothetical protein
MREESAQSKMLRLKAFAGRVDEYVIQQWLRRRRDSLSTARALGLEPSTIGAVVNGQMRYDEVDR